MTGTLYSVGVGPGDPELMTIKAIRLIREADVVAIPQGDGDVLTAKDIVGKVIDLDAKELLMLYMPMTKDVKAMEDAHNQGAEAIIKYLKAGKNVVFITLGDPTVYATSIYVHKRVRAGGYKAELVAGVPSFCAAAARLNIALCERGEPLIILPGSYRESAKFLDVPGTKVLMKSGSQLAKVRDELKQRQLLLQAAMVERCGLDGEKVYWHLDNIDTQSSYFSIILVKAKEIRE